jgi:predicted neutral ceramidase superfamily lipid hydrolase
MNYLEYLNQPHYLALVCAVVSIIVAFAESKFSKTKYDSKYYLKVGVIVLVNVYVVVQLIKNNYLTLDAKTATQSGGSSLATGTLPDVSSINPSNYASVDTGNPNF